MCAAFETTPVRRVRRAFYMIPWSYAILVDPARLVRSCYDARLVRSNGFSPRFHGGWPARHSCENGSILFSPQRRKGREGKTTEGTEYTERISRGEHTEPAPVKTGVRPYSDDG